MIRIFIFFLLVIGITGCGLHKFEQVSYDMPDGSTLEISGEWAETFSLGYIGTRTYRCGSDYIVIEQNSFGENVVVENIDGCTEVNSFAHADRGLLRGAVETAGPAAIGGYLYMKGQEKRRPDQIDIQNEGSQASSEATGGEAFAEGGQGGAGGAGGSASVSVVNSNSQSQGQGQAQGQGQHQGQSNYNANHNNNTNINKPTAISAPHISNKPTFNNNNINKPVNVNKPTFNNTNQGGHTAIIGCRNNCGNANGNGQGGFFNNNTK